MARLDAERRVESVWYLRCEARCYRGGLAEMSIPGSEGVISELPLTWRKAGVAFFAALVIGGSYFFFVAQPLAAVQDNVLRNNHRLDHGEESFKEIRGEIAANAVTQAMARQQLADLQHSVDMANDKLDRMLMAQHRGAYP